MIGCETCPFTTKYSHSMDRHNRAVHGGGKREHPCPHCAYSAKEKHHLVKHVREVHERVRVHKCLKCGKQFSTKYCLLRHDRLVHLGVKAFECHLCTKTFSLKFHLEKHIHSVHFKEKPFHCNVCEKSFSSKWGLVRHLNKVHQTTLTPETGCALEITRKLTVISGPNIQNGQATTNGFPANIVGTVVIPGNETISLPTVPNVPITLGESPQICEICTKVFLRKNDLARHMKLHEAATVVTVSGHQPVLQSAETVYHGALGNVPVSYNINSPPTAVISGNKLLMKQWPYA